MQRPRILIGMSTSPLRGALTAGRAHREGSRRDAAEALPNVSGMVPTCTTLDGEPDSQSSHTLLVTVSSTLRGRALETPTRKDSHSRESMLNT
jgi:hypothetical protein